MRRTLLCPHQLLLPPTFCFTVPIMKPTNNLLESRNRQIHVTELRHLIRFNHTEAVYGKIFVYWHSKSLDLHVTILTALNVPQNIEETPDRQQQMPFDQRMTSSKQTRLNRPLTLTLASKLFIQHEQGTVSIRSQKCNNMHKHAARLHLEMQLLHRIM